MKQHHKYLYLALFLTLLSNNLFSEDLRAVRLQLKWKHQFQFAGYYAAVEKGFYRDAGFDVKIRELGDNETPFDAVFNGQAEFGTCTTDILQARSEGKKAVVLATIFQHSPHIIITLKKSGIQNVHGLVGKKIAVEPGSLELYAFLIAEGVALNRCIIEEYDFNSNKLTSGAVDAITAYSTDEPYAFRESGQDINILYPASAGIDFYGDLLFTSEDMIRNDPIMVEKFRVASLKGWAYAMNHHEEIVNLIYTKYSKRHSLDHLRFEADQMQRLIMPNVVEIGYTNPGRWGAILDNYKKFERVNQSLTTKGLLYDDYIKHDIQIPWKFIIIFSIAFIIIFIFFIFNYYSLKKLHKEILKREIIQNELAISESLYRSILKASPDCIAVANLQGMIHLVSISAIQLLGCESENDVCGKKFTEFLHPDERDQAITNSLLLLNGIYFGPKEYQLLKADGSLTETEINSDIFRDTTGKPAGLVFIVRDIHERKQREAKIKEMNEKLVSMNAEKDRFFSIIAHDLRSPFTAFLGYTQLLLEDIQTMEADKIRIFAENLNKSAVNLFRLLENLLEWSRMEQGLTVPKPCYFFVNDLIDENLKMISDAAQLKKLVIETEIDLDYQVEADYQMTETVLRNLLSNAIKFTPREGKITISSAKTSENFIEVAVHDTGIGMSEEMIASMFNIDANNRRPGTEGESSTGLGLLLCKEFVELNGGTFTISSEEGKGSVFSFTLKKANTDEH